MPSSAIIDLVVGADVAQVDEAQQHAGEVASHHQGAGVHPGHAALPALHVGRVEDALAQDARRDPDELAHGPDPQPPSAADHVVDRRQDARPDAVVGIELGVHEEGPQEGEDLVVRAPQEAGVGRLAVGPRLAALEPPEQSTRDPLGARLLLQEDADQAVGVETAAAAEDRLAAVVVVAAGELEAAPGGGAPADAIAGQRARRLADVVLGVVALPEAEELHDLTREVLVGLAAAVGDVVEVHEHRRVLEHRAQQHPVVAQGVLVDQLGLTDHVVAALHGGLGAREEAVPEEPHAIPQRVLAADHALEPLRHVVDGLAGHLLPDLLDDADALLLIHGADALEVGHARLVLPGELGTLGGQQVLDQGLLPGLDPALDLGRGGAEAGAVEEVLRLACGPGLGRSGGGLGREAGEGGQEEGAHGCVSGSRR